MTLTEFLLARIAEDEAVARAMLAPGEMHPWGDTRKPEGQSEDVPAWVRGYLGGTWGEHFARHNPARVLAECAFKREIVRLWSETEEGTYGDQGPSVAAEAAYALAAVYADHTHYDPAWRP